MLLLALSLIAVVSSAERAATHREQPLVTIISEPQGEREHHVSVVVEADGRIREVIRRSTAGHSVATADDLIRGRVALAGHDALLVSCPECDARTGGRLVLEYLNNGVTGRYVSRSVRLERRVDGFRLTTEQGEPIQRLRLTARRFLGMLVGIGDVVVE
jgi:hypothetical protein